MFLYLTADHVGQQSGGGRVTHEEAAALAALASLRGADFRLVDRPALLAGAPGVAPDEPWGWDCLASHHFGDRVKLAHLYAGTFGASVRKLKDAGAAVAYTVAAHDRAVSRREHEKYGIAFAQLYPHLCDEALWQRYVSGYRLADVIVCPSTVAASTVRGYGPDFARKRIEVIPHGCDAPAGPPAPLPARFVVGYLGSLGADKGVVYLLQAWKQLAYPDATLLIGGRDSASPWFADLVRQQGGGNVVLAGWQADVGAFYDRLSLYAQPSATEGWGCEVVEAAARGRPVVVSAGAGAVDFIQGPGAAAGRAVPAGDADALAAAIDHARSEGRLAERGRAAAAAAQAYAWPVIRGRYQALWTELLEGRP